MASESPPEAAMTACTCASAAAAVGASTEIHSSARTWCLITTSNPGIAYPPHVVCRRESVPLAAWRHGRSRGIPASALRQQGRRPGALLLRRNPCQHLCLRPRGSRTCRSLDELMLGEQSELFLCARHAGIGPAREFVEPLIVPAKAGITAQIGPGDIHPWPLTTLRRMCGQAVAEPDRDGVEFKIGPVQLCEVQ